MNSFRKRGSTAGRWPCGSVWVFVAVACCAVGPLPADAEADKREANARDFGVDGFSLGAPMEDFRRRFPKARAIRGASGHPPGHQGFMLEGRATADVPVAYGFFFTDGRLYEIRILWRKEDPGAPLLTAYFHSLFGVYGADRRSRGTTHEFPDVNRTVTVSSFRNLEILSVAETSFAEEVGRRLVKR